MIKEEYVSIADTYVQALRLSDIDIIRSIFDKAAVVKSPVYGDVLASAFYEKLFGVTRESILRIIDIFLAVDNPRRMAIHFEYTWNLLSGDYLEFKVVDVIELNEHGKIKTLEIIYDAAQARSAVRTAGAPAGRDEARHHAGMIPKRLPSAR